jgi:hypothetical protein
MWRQWLDSEGCRHDSSGNHFVMQLLDAVDDFRKREAEAPRRLPRQPNP